MLFHKFNSNLNLLAYLSSLPLLLEHAHGNTYPIHLSQSRKSFFSFQISIPSHPPGRGTGLNTYRKQITSLATRIDSSISFEVKHLTGANELFPIGPVRNKDKLLSKVQSKGLSNYPGQKTPIGSIRECRMNSESEWAIVSRPK